MLKRKRSWLQKKLKKNKIKTMNLWHDITIGKNAPEDFNCIIEISKGSHKKYEIEKDTGMIKLDRANYGPAAYPADPITGNNL